VSRLCTTALLAALLLGPAPGAADDKKAADWPQFRGAKRNNHSPDKGLLKTWPKDGPPLAWKVEGLGGGYSSVAVVGDRVYTMGNKKDSSNVVCIDAKTKKVLWSTPVGKQGGDLGCTPTVDGDRVYALGQFGDLVCLDTAKGKVQWTKNLVKEFGGAYGGWKYTESPLIDGDRLICTPGGKKATMAALKKKNGEVVWKCAADIKETTAGYSSPVIAEVGGVRQYVQLLSGGVIGVDAKEGKLLWKYEKLGNNTANIPTPVVLEGGKVFCCAGYGKGGALLQLTKAEDGGIKVKEEYFNRKLTNKHGGVVVVGDHVYGDTDDSGRPFCAEVKTGKVLWRRGDNEGSGNESASVTYADGKLYFRYQNGVMALVEASDKEYKEISSFKLPKLQGPSWSHPVVVGGKLYLREGDLLYCYNVKK
jgi:outer membrane protein assembly factor BamB